MSVETVLATIGNDVKGFYAKLSADFQKARQVWLLVSSAQTRSLLLTIGADAIKTVKDAATAIDAKGLSLTIDEAVVADIEKLIADAKAGDDVIVADLKALGITL
jgi:poly-gamma-glutamate capsule biosynthesis protein CapA/YwtB (metallophosphatase superfamily)